MRARLVLILLGTVLLVGGGCASRSSTQHVASITGVVVDPEYLTSESFTDMGHSEESVMLRLITPEDMNGRVVSVVLWEQWGKRLTTYGKREDWVLQEGDTVSLELKMQHLAQSQGPAPWRVRADHVRIVRKEPNQTLQTTRYGARRLRSCLI